MQANWELSQSLTCDGQGIRCACVLPAPDGTADGFQILTGTQGGSLVAYGIPSGNLESSAYRHDNAVTALATNATGTHYFTGCKDAVVRVFDAQHNLIAQLKGHDKAVTSLAYADGGKDGEFLISGSWDGTAKIWRLANSSLVATLPNHENSVCVCVQGVDTGGMLHIATGSAGLAQNNTIQGHSIRIWTVDVRITSDVKLLHTVANDHDGPIRDLCLAPPDASFLASCSNDGTVKLRVAETGDVLTTLTMLTSSHPPMLLSVATTTDQSCVVVGAEDGHAVVWDLSATDRSPQILLHAQCVWSVVPLPNGDFATCSDDGVIRIFTHCTERVAPLAEREAWEAEVAATHQKKSNGPSAEEIAALPRWDQNYEKRGRSEGDVRVFQKNGVAIAAQWSAASQTWIEVGQVTGSNENTGTLNGVQYDHLLPIEVDQSGGGVAKLQIGYNNGENPFVAAQRFIDDHVLPQHHLQDIANYIQQRAGQQGPTIGNDSTVASGSPMVSYEYLPAPGYKQFGLPVKTASTTLAKVKSKIIEFGLLSDIDVEHLTHLLDTLSASSRYHSSKILDEELAVMEKMLSWQQPSQVFPALDLARLVLLHPDAASRERYGYWSRVVPKTIAIMAMESVEGPAAVAIPMLGLRLFSNGLKGGPGSCEAIANNGDAILEVTKRLVPSSNKNVRLALATLLYNTACYVRSNPGTDISDKFFPIVSNVLSSKTYEEEATFRTLVALGTLVMASSDAKEAANASFLSSKVEMAASPHGSEVKAAAKEVYAVLQ